jgi:hypothetical protein
MCYIDGRKNKYSGNKSYSPKMGVVSPGLGVQLEELKPEGHMPTVLLSSQDVL